MPAVISPFVLAKIGASAARELFLTGGALLRRRGRERSAWCTRSCPRPSSTQTVEGYVHEHPDAAPRAPSPPPSASIARGAGHRPRRRDRPDDGPDRRAADVGGRPGRHARVPREAASPWTLVMSRRAARPHRQPRRDRRPHHRAPAARRDRERRRLLRRRRARAARRRGRSRGRHRPAARESYLSIEALLSTRPSRAAPTPSIPATASSRSAPRSRARARPPASRSSARRPTSSTAWDRRSARARSDGRGPACRSSRARRRRDQTDDGIARGGAQPRLPGAAEGLGGRRRQGHAHRRAATKTSSS